MKHVFHSIFVILLALVTVTAFGDDPLQFEEGDLVERWVPENGPAALPIGAPVTATGGNGNPLTYYVAEGDPAGDRFNLNSETGQLRAREVFNYEDLNKIEVTLKVTDDTNIAETTVQINVRNVNEAPNFAQDFGIRMGSMDLAGTPIGEPVSATDPDLTDLNADANPDTPEADPLTYTLGGEYANLFDIDSMTGQLRTIPPANYGGIPGPYIVTVTVSDSHFTHATAITIFLALDPLEVETVDETPPEVNISVPAGVQNSAFNVVITFTEEVSDFEQADLTLSGTAIAGITGWSVTDDTVFTATITPTTSGEVVVSVRADVATDAASNNNTASEAESVTVDMMPPEVRISVPAGVQNDVFNVVITFTEEVSDFDQADLTFSGTSTASITGWLVTDDTVFTATITPATSGEVVVSVGADVATDAAGNNNTASEAESVTVDITPPEVRISVPAGVQKTAFDVVITFTEVVSGFEQADLTLSGTATASITGWLVTDDTVFTATITPTTSGDVVVSVRADVATDATGNNNTASDAESVTVDMPAEVRISVPAGVQNSAFNVVITFTEVVSGFDQADLTLSGTSTASITGWSTPDDTVFTATITPTTSGDVVVGVMADVATDAAGNNNTASEAESVTVDITPPEVRISVPAGVQNSAFNVVITFTEEVSDFNQADLTLSGTSTAGITGWATPDDTVFTAIITPTTSGDVVVSVGADVARDAAGNNNTASDAESVTVDITPPEVRISVPDGVQKGAFNVVITFTEEVSDFERTDLTLSGTAMASIGGWSTPDDTVFTARITPETSGDVGVRVMAGVATDAAGNSNTASDSETVTVDMPPGVSISVPDGVQKSMFDVVITFTEPVSGFAYTDVTFSGTATASIEAWSITDDTVFTATIGPVTSGTLTLRVMAGVATDATGNNNTASEAASVTLDVTPPEVSVSVPDGVQKGAFDVVITFTEVVSHFNQANVMLSGTAIASITGWSTTDDTVFTATITPETSGDVVVSVMAEEVATVTVDMWPPEARISVPNGDQRAAFDVTITFTEVVSGFEQTDLTLSGPVTASITRWSTTDDTVWTATITPTTSGTLTLHIAEGAVTDTVGNTNLANVTAEVSIFLHETPIEGDGNPEVVHTPEEGVHTPEFVSVCDRTPAVRDAILAAVPGVNDCEDVTAADLASITELRFGGGEMITLQVHDFRGLTGLQYLQLHDTTNLPAGIFDELTALETLSLFNNSLRSLPSDIFDKLTALKELNLLYNRRLDSLPEDIFDKLTVLEALSLSSTRLSGLPSDIFDKLTVLERLSLSSNELSDLPADIFDDLSKLETLYLEGNVLRSLPDGIFDDLAALTFLSLSSNSLNTLPAGLFDNLIALERLHLEHNELRGLPDGIFDKLAALKRLHLEHNVGLNDLPAGLFDELIKLEELRLGSTGLSSLPADLFRKLIELKYLFLNSNNLSSLPAGLFEGLTKLESLYLHYNPTDPFPVTVSLEKVGEDEFKALVPIGAPFDIVIPLSVTNGSLEGEESSSLTISTGTVESKSVRVIRRHGTVDAVTVDIEGLPPPPSSHLLAVSFSLHSGYELVPSADLPLTIIEGAGAAPGMVSEVVLPEETGLSANYPNPFNPETWIPYQLANPSDVVISIYDARGQIVRRLVLGHQAAGYYNNRSRAAYWDGRNDLGERVSSGLYFYHLRADNLSLLRKMVILK